MNTLQQPTDNHLSDDDIRQIIFGQIVPPEETVLFNHWKNCPVCRDKLLKQITGAGFTKNGQSPHSISHCSTSTSRRFYFACDKRSVIAASFEKEDLYRTLRQIPNIDPQPNPTKFSTNISFLIANYFTGKPIPRIPINPFLIKTDFMRRVLFWTWLVPFGEIITYGDIAAWLGQAGASRAVGGALHRNPIPLFIPCHRVVGKTGSLTGFAAGVQTKKWLLEIERNHLD